KAEGGGGGQKKNLVGLRGGAVGGLWGGGGFGVLVGPPGGGPHRRAGPRLPAISGHGMRASSCVHLSRSSFPACHQHVLSSPGPAGYHRCTTGASVEPSTVSLGAFVALRHSSAGSPRCSRTVGQSQSRS